MYGAKGFNGSSAAAYRQVDLNSQVLSASPHGLIALLYADVQQCLTAAQTAIASGDTATKARAINKAMRLVDEGLLAGLDMRAGGALAANLHRIYSWCLLRLAQAQTEANARVALNEVQAALQPLMEGWNGIAAQSPQAGSAAC